MAYVDYYHCDVCKEKAFYDANIEDPRYVGRYDETVRAEGFGMIDIKALCPSCAKTHRVVVEPRN